MPTVPLTQSRTQHRISNSSIRIPLDGAPHLHDASDRRSLRVAYFTGNYHHVRDGVSLTLNRLVNFMQRSGHASLVFGPTVPRPALEHSGRLISVPSASIPGRKEYRLTCAFPGSVQRELEAFRPDLVHVATPDYLGWRAVRWARLHGVPVVASHHTQFDTYLAYYRLGWLKAPFWKCLRSFYNLCSEVYVPSPSIGSTLREHGVTSPVRLWSRGVDRGLFGPQHRSVGWRAAMGFAPDIPVLTFVSRIVWEKGLDVFAQVVRNLEAEGVPHHSVVVGDGPARATLEAQLPRTVFTGQLSGLDLARAYASSDAFLFPSHTETFGNVTLEAMASGLPVVAADAPGSRSLVRTGVSGFLCTPGDAADFTSAARSLLLDPMLRADFGAQGTAIAARFDWENVMASLVRRYENILQTDGARVTLSPAIKPNLNLDGMLAGVGAYG